MTKKKYEREIAEILERLERQGQGPPRPAPRRQREPLPEFRPPIPGSSTPERGGGVFWLALAIGLPLLGVLLYRVVPIIGIMLVLIGILAFLSPLGARLIGLARPEQPNLWRGRVIEMPRRGSRTAFLRYYLWVMQRNWEHWRAGRR